MTNPARVRAASTLLLILSLLASLLVALPASAVTGSGDDFPAGGKEPGTGRFIVLLDEAPLARYEGGVAGLAATAPVATGADRLDVGTAASQAYLAHLDARQTSIIGLAGAALGRPLDVFGRYRVTLNGFAAVMSAAEAGAVASIPGVSRVGPDVNRYLQTDNGPEWIGAPGIWDGSESGGMATRGEGIVAGVIDTGVNHDHPSFADVGGDGYDHTNPRGTYYGLCSPIDGAPFCNEKLIGVYDFTGTGPEDDNGHGSHTASTTAGNVVDASLVGPTITIDRPISGVAPHANLITYKACVTTPAIGTCPLSALLLAIDQATADAVDVVNFSIGGGSSDPWTDFDAQAMLNGRAAGVFFSVSAGNEGPGASTVGSPADAPWVMAVAANTHDREFINTLEGMSGGSGAAPADMVGASVTSALTSTPIVYAGDYGFPLCGEGPANAGTGEAAINPFTPGTFDGQIVVCDRGTYGRVEKAQNVMEGGAGGFVLANDEPSGDSVVADAYPIPGVNVSHADGIVLKAWLAGGGEGHVAAIGGTVANEAVANADIMASFSSRGPNPASGDILKPDVTAPGVDILAAFHTPATASGGPTEYGVISGTSMSSPHAAGSAVLIRALHPGWSPAEVQSALMTSSFTSLPGAGREVHEVLKEDGVSSADPFDMGAGRVNLHAAGRAGIVLDESAENYAAADPALDGDATTINTASLAQDACEGTCSWHRTLTGAAAGTVGWTASGSGGAMALSVEPESFSLAPGEEVTITVTADVTSSPPDAWQFGTVTLTPNDGSVAGAHLPVAAFATAAASSFDAPVLDDPGETDTTGAYDLVWSDVSAEIGYEVQQAANLNQAFTDDAESGMAGRWTTEAAPGGWSDSILQSNSGDGSYWSGQGDDRLSTLTLVDPISVPAGAEATVSFASWEDTEPDFDYGHVEGSSDGGETWQRFLTINGLSDGWADRSAVLRGLSGDVLIRFVYDTDQLVSAPLYLGWFIDDVAVEVASWVTIAQTDADATTSAVVDQPNGTFHHRVAGRFDTGGANTTFGPWSNVVDIVVDRPLQADLQVTGMSAADPRPKEGRSVVLRATVANDGEAPAAPSETEFRLDGGEVIGAVATPEIAAGGTTVVEIGWKPNKVNGEQAILATADVGGSVDESDESNNGGRLPVTVRGNKVTNGSFEQTEHDGSTTGWQSGSTAAGTTSSSTDDASDGERSLTITGTGRSVAVAGAPTWTSAPIEVRAGEVLTLVADVRTDGVSSTPSLGVAYIGPAGELLSAVTLVTAPLRSDGFAELEQLFTVPAGVASVRVVLAGFGASDLATRGTITFDDVGLYAD